MEIKNGQDKRLAVLIDADNASPAIIEPLLAEVSKYGVATVKRIYGDWTSPSLGGWKKVLASFAIHPIQQFRHTVGKNATDSAMIIDAMDLLYTKRFNGFCIVSSDSDFTRLASRIREEGAIVYGFGERKTPDSFVSACDKFIYTEILKKDKGPRKSSTKKVSKGPERKNAEALNRDEKLVSILFDAVDAVADEDGWARLGSVGSKISNQYPSFDSRNYGYAKLSSLIRAINLFIVATRQAGTDPKNRSIYVKRK
ncbi:MAG: NYN domain-containing protein [Candidatus Tritonobacter lacicola]|nr:NYN domain-containing protein [Candidatus Tritonobacter lacicola]